ncbi:MAG: tryptophan synthase subunit beta [Chloroflexota bacterium]|nr:tryptophan synthase subunit beta [Chloroflexota bacterium]MDE2899181.1 tryptophan synthase subunit beta [Chloroflexota bacterium]
MLETRSLPDAAGFYGPFGGRYVPETLVAALDELEASFQRHHRDPAFVDELEDLLHFYAGRPTPTYHATRLSRELGGAQIYLKREDLAHTGAHKINNALGQGLLARVSGKQRVIAETGAGQHGVASATVCAMLGLDCVVYMGEEDVHRQALNVARMRTLGAEVIPVTSGTRTLKDAINEALRDWVTNVETTFYLFGSATGPHPYPQIVREFQRVIGREARAQIQDLAGSLPHTVVACVNGGSNAIGMFSAFIDDPGVTLVGIEAGGRGGDQGDHAATVESGTPGILHGARSLLLQDEGGQIIGTHSIAAGLDYPGVGPELAYLHHVGRVDFATYGDADAMDALQLLARTEGIIPALESAHAVACAVRIAPEASSDHVILVNLSGRGDKDMETIAAELGTRV